MESGAELLSLQDIATVRVAEEIPAAKTQRNYWWMEENCPRLKKSLVNSMYPSLRGQRDEACLEFGLDPVTKQTVLNVLQKIGRNLITYENFFPMKKREFLSENHVNHVEDIIVK